MGNSKRRTPFESFLDNVNLTLVTQPESVEGTNFVHHLLWSNKFCLSTGTTTFPLARPYRSPLQRTPGPPGPVPGVDVLIRGPVPENPCVMSRSVCHLRTYKISSVFHSLSSETVMGEIRTENEEVGFK